MVETEKMHPVEKRALENGQKFKPYQGTVVRFNMHLGSHISDLREAMYVCLDEKDSWGVANFVMEKVESLDGKVGFNGISSHLCDVGLNEDGTFTVYRDDYYPSRILLHNDYQARLNEVVEMWERRKR